MATIAKSQQATFATTDINQNGLQQMGGIAGIVAAITFIIGFIFFVTTLAPLVSGELTAVETVEFLQSNQTLFYVWNLIIYVLFGIVQAVLTLALYERLKSARPATAQITVVLGLVWSGLVIASGMVSNVGASTVINLYASDPALAGTIWTAVDTVSIGLGGGNEIVGGLWVLLVSWIALRDVLPKALNYLGMIVGVAGIVTLVPALTEVGAIFGLGIIVWYIWVGIVLLRNKQ